MIFHIRENLLNNLIPIIGIIWQKTVYFNITCNRFTIACPIYFLSNIKKIEINNNTIYYINIYHNIYMETHTLPLVPFGKYKGQPITALINDTKYLEWCKQQEWFQKFPIVYNICVNQTIAPTTHNSKTPEHNKLQNLFLEDNNVIKLGNCIINRWSKSSRHVPHTISRHKIEFEGAFNWDCIFELDAECKCNGGRSCCSDKYPEMTMYVFSEIKPLMGDDYPCVLRKMKTQIHLTNNDRTWNAMFRPIYRLIIKEYASTTTSIDAVKKIFRQSNISIIFIHEILDNELIKPVTLLEDVPKLDAIIPEDIGGEIEIDITALQTRLLEVEEENAALHKKIAQLEEIIQLSKCEVTSCTNTKKRPSECIIANYFKPSVKK